MPPPAGSSGVCQRHWIGRYYRDPHRAERGSAVGRLLVTEGWSIAGHRYIIYQREHTAMRSKLSNFSAHVSGVRRPFAALWLGPLSANKRLKGAGDAAAGRQQRRLPATLDRTVLTATPHRAERGSAVGRLLVTEGWSIAGHSPQVYTYQREHTAYQQKCKVYIGRSWPVAYCYVFVTCFPTCMITVSGSHCAVRSPTVVLTLHV